MPTSVFFNNFMASGEQGLIEDLIIESIRMYGLDIHYVPRTLRKYDAIYGEDTISEYNNSYMMEAYIRNVEGFGGDGDFLSKFNLEIRDTVTLTIAQRVWNDEVGDVVESRRPREGDLIYFPLNQKVFVVKFVEHEAIFYQLGALQTYDLRCELWEYSNEILNTGISVIDNMQKNLSQDMVNQAIRLESEPLIETEDNNTLVLEAYDIVAQSNSAFADNTKIETEADAIIDFDETNPFADEEY